MNSENFLRGFLIVAMIAGLVLLIGGLAEVVGGDKSGLSQIVIGAGGLSCSGLLWARRSKKESKNNDD